MAMVEHGGTSSSSSSPPSSNLMKVKPVVVRLKRKASQARLDAFWLEINERPIKRPSLDFESLSISDSAGKVLEESRSKKLLVQHVETVSHSEGLKDVLQSFLPDSIGSKDFRRKIEERRSTLKQDKKKQDQLRCVARQKHEDLVKSARFEQIWSSRRGSKEANDDKFRELCHLYDVVRVDIDDQKSGKVQEPECRDVSVEDDAILCNYLPLIREFLPSVAEEIASEMNSYSSKEENYVYDLYTVDANTSGDKEDTSTEYPLVEVNAEDDYYDGPLQSEYESDDSNAEDNPHNDYPDEESGDDGNEESGDDDEGSDSQYEEEIVDVDEEYGEDLRWGYR